MERAHWPNKWVFILAAIGSAAGLGNLWRFPFLAYEHGGGAFVLAIIIANIVIGIPLLVLEIGLGQKTQKGAPDAFGHIKKSFRLLGWTALVMGFMVLAYYMSVMGWSVGYLAGAFDLAWKGGASDFFFGTVLNISDRVGETGGIHWPLFSGALIAWILIYLAVRNGVKSVSKVVKWTATLPFVILGILIIRAVTLPGAEEGLRIFFSPEWSALADPQLWLAAFSQVFFSLSIAFGVMVAYGSFQQRNSEIAKSALWIAGGNFLVSLMSGIVIFGTLGYMALTNGTPFAEVVAGGPSLAFVVFPTAITLLPAFNTLIAILFFGTLILLGIDSAFSLLEGFATPFKDRYPNVPTRKIAFVITVVGIIAGLFFVTRAGLYYLDILDHFIVSYGLVIVGLLEALIVGWFWKGSDFVKFINENSDWKIGERLMFSIKFLIPLFLIILLAVNLANELKAPYEGYPSWALLYIGVMPILMAPVIGAVLDKLTSKSKTTD